MLKKLINGQRIIIDRHRRGTNEPNIWDKDVHIDKRFNGENKRFANATIKVPLVNGRQPTFKVNKVSDELLKKRIITEINSVLRDEKQLTDFVKDVIKEIGNFQSTSSEETKIVEAFGNIARHIELKPEIVKRINVEVDNHIKSITTIHKDNQNKFYFMTLSSSYLKIGEIDRNSKLDIRFKNL